MAADMPVKSPVYAAPFSWTGFYIGAHVGWGWGSVKWSDACVFVGEFCEVGSGPLHPGPTGRYNLSGFLGGGQVGYNWQSGWAVLGVEADASGADIKGSESRSCLISVDACTSKIDALGTITGMFGGAFDRALVYVKGGGAWLREKHTMRDAGDVATSSDTKWGWTLGAGLEYAFAPNWSGKIEYDFLDFGKETHTVRFPDMLGRSADVRQTMQTVKLGINYRFGGPGY
jgi:outer membrane immunogenic protein